MRELLEQGISIVYISHRLEEIMEIGDHVTILRDGKYVADADVKDIELSWIVENMVGKNTQYHRFERSIDLDHAEKILELKGTSADEKDKLLCTLVVDMLNYGAAAQKYFGRNVSYGRGDLRGTEDTGQERFRPD